MSEFTLAAIEDAAARVHRAMPPTPQYAWPLLAARAGAEIWVKHENHTPVGAFKVRGGVLHMADLAKAKPGLAGVIAATRGNHGQSIAFGAARAGLKATIVVPHGNSVEKNAAMRAQGAELVEHGHDFQAALEHCRALADARGLHFVAVLFCPIWCSACRPMRWSSSRARRRSIASTCPSVWAREFAA
jgi:threonine dehydratase